jgi:DNA repair exonuclease SbcCD ATPase subunit
MEANHKIAITTLKKASEDQLRPHRIEVETIHFNLKQAKQAEENSRKSLEVETQRVKNHQDRLAALVMEAKELEDTILLYSEEIQLLGPKGYRAACFDSLIVRIGDMANRYLQILTGGTFSTRLDQIGENNKGQQKIVLKPIIMKGGIEVPQDFLSGGIFQRFSIVYDLAINAVAGDGLPLFLDEAMSQIDSEGRLLLLPLLEEIARERFVAIIDHSDSFKAAISNVWIARYSNGVSRLETNLNSDSDVSKIEMEEIQNGPF